MRILPRSLKRIGKRFRRKSSRKETENENSEEDLESKMARELEETLMENSDFLYLKGEKLRTYERRMKDLAKLLTRGAPLPMDMDRLSQLQNTISSKSVLAMGDGVAGPSRSLDFAQDLIQSVHDALDDDSEYTTETVRSIPEWTHDDGLEIPHDMSDSTTMDLTPAFRSVGSTSHTELERLDGASEGMRSVPLSAEDTLMGDAMRKDALAPESENQLLGLFAKMNEWSTVSKGYTFVDENSPLPMKVNSFFALDTQTVSLSLDDNAPHKPRRPEPEDSFSSKEGILFSIGSQAINGEQQIPSYKGHFSDRASSPAHIDPKRGVLLNRLRSKMITNDKTCSFAHVRAVSDYPSSVWEDVAPTRLSTNITNISMDKPQVLRSS